jgi:hypothetical protein
MNTLGKAENESTHGQEQSRWQDAVDSETTEFYRKHLALVDALVELPAHRILGLAMGALAGVARRMAVSPPQQGGASPAGRAPSEALAQAGESCACVLEQWLRQLLADPCTSQARVESLGAFQAGTFSAAQLVDDQPQDCALPLDLRVAARVAGTLVRTLDSPTEAAEEPPTMAARLEHAARILGDEWVHLSEARTGFGLDYIGRILRREGGYALLQLESVYDVHKQSMAEAPENAAAATATQDYLARERADARQRVVVRMKLESDPSDRYVLTPKEAREHLRPLSP